MNCPHCNVPMLRYRQDRQHCPRCPRYALPGDGPADVERHELDRQEALALLDAALGERAHQREADKRTLAEMEDDMGQLIQTKGCGKCGGTMYKTVETDQHGNPIGSGPYVCTACGNMEG